MKFAGIFISLLLILAIHYKAESQNNNVSLKLVTRFQDFKIQERVLLIPDQDFYLAGESVTLFAMTYDAALRIPVEFSSILYVELYNQNNKVVAANKYLLKHGEAKNRLFIPKELETGYYYIRAYTNYMKNWGPGVFFTQRLKVVNPFRHQIYSPEEKSQQNKMQMKVAVEGGLLTSGIENRIAFQCIPTKDPLRVELYENESVVARVNSADGAGFFNITPVENKHYKVGVTSPANNKSVVELADVVPSGVVCRLDSVIHSDAYLQIVTHNFDKYPLSLFVQNNGLLYQYSAAFDKPANAFKMTLPTGLNDVIIKNRDNQIVSQRSVYIASGPGIHITAHCDKQTFLPGDSLTLHISSEISDSMQYLVVINTAQPKDFRLLHDHIDSFLYNMSIGAYVNQELTNEQFSLGKDLNMINQRILTLPIPDPEMPATSEIQYLPEIANDIVTGGVTTKDKRSVVSSGNVYLSFVDSLPWINRCQTDSTGRFVAQLPMHYQGKDLVITVNDTTHNYSVQLDSEFDPRFLKMEKEAYFPDSSLKEVIEARMINLQINDAYSVPLKGWQISRPGLRFYGSPDKVYSFRKYVNLPSLKEFVFEIAAEIETVKNGAQEYLKVRVSGDVEEDGPMIIFDGVPLSNSHGLATIPCKKLESIRVVTSKFFWGADSYDGIIDITSNTKSLSLVDPGKNATRVAFSPVITTQDEDRSADLRVPRYVTGIYFDKINSVSGNADIRLRLPQNRGKCLLQIYGYRKTGEWGTTTLPDIISIAR